MTDDCALVTSHVDISMIMMMVLAVWLLTLLLAQRQCRSNAFSHCRIRLDSDST